MNTSLKRFALIFSAALVLTGFAAHSSHLALGPHGSEPPLKGALPSDTNIVVFVNWGASNMGNQGNPCTDSLGTGQEPCFDDPPEEAYEWWSFEPGWGGDDPPYEQDVFPLHDPVPTRGDPHSDDDSTKGSFWHALVNPYYDATGHIVFMSNGSQDGSGSGWQPGHTEGLYEDGLVAIERAMTKAVALRDSLYPGYDVVFGGVVWSLSPGLSASANEYPWADYRAQLDNLLDHFEQDVVANYPGARFYFVSTVVPKGFQYPDYDAGDVHTAPEVTFALDLEADACAEYAFCSMVHASDPIKRAQQECRDDNYPQDDPFCDGWYNTDSGDVHWGQRGFNLIGDMVGPVITEHAPHGSTSPHAWELAVEVPSPIAWCADAQPDDCPDVDDSEVPDLRLDVYDDAGALVDTFYVRPTLDNPDWRADFDGSDSLANWQASWASLSTEFLTLEVVREGGGPTGNAPADTLARYAYVPTAVAYGTGQTGFFRPDDGGPALAAHVEVFADDSVKARAQHTPGLYFEDAFAGGSDAYVMPYNHDHYESACGAACPSAPADFFLARLPLDEPRPDGTLRRFTFADEADTPIPSTWGTLAWSADSLVLAFPAERRLVVEGDLTAEGVVLTEAEAGTMWGGVAVYEPGSLDFDGVTVTAAEFGLDVNSDGNTFTDVLLDENGVGILTGYACGPGGCTGLPTRSAFTLNESCVTNSVFSSQLGLEGHGIWARHTDALVWSSTVEGNGAYGLFLDDADVTPYRLLLQDNGANDTSAPDGARVDPGGDLSLVILATDPLSGENRIESNVADQLNVRAGGYATVGLATTGLPRNHLALGSASDFIILNDLANASVSAVRTYWGTGGSPPTGSIQNANTAQPLSTSPSGSAGHPGTCTGAGADLTGGGSLLRGGSPERGAGTASRSTASPRGAASLRGSGSEPREIAPEVAAWFASQIDSLRLALAGETRAEAVRALYAFQRLDRYDDLGERAQTMGLLGGLAEPLVQGTPLPTPLREAAEAALVAQVHDALRAGRFDDARALLAPFVEEPEPLPEIEGELGRRTLALALVALDEQVGDLPSAIGRIEAVLAELGPEPSPEEESLARDLQATAALLMRRLEGESGGQGFGRTAQTRSGDLPAAYALGRPYPNPFTGTTAVPFALPEDTRVEIRVYDLLGRRVAVLADAEYEAGRHVVTLDARGLASGVYVVRAVMETALGASAPARVFTRRITLIR